MRVAKSLLDRRAEDDGSREVYVVRALLALKAEGKEVASASQIMERASTLAEQQDADVWGLDSAKRMGRLLTRMGIPKAPRGNHRGYQIDPGTLARLQATFLPPSERNVGNDGNDGNDGEEDADTDVTDVTDVCDVSSVRSGSEKELAWVRTIWQKAVADD
jgi:hypothetical protein